MSDAPHNPPADLPAMSMHPPLTGAPADPARSGRCLACGFDLAGLGQDALCPECGRDPGSARAAFMKRMRRVWIGARAARGILICVLLLMLLGPAGALLISGLPGQALDAAGGALRVLMPVLISLPLLAIPILAIVGIWNMATPPLPTGAGGAWLYPLARWCAVGAAPLWIAAGLSQRQSVELAGILASCGVLFVGAALLALFRIRADIARLLGVSAWARTGLIGQLLACGIAALMLSVPIIYAMSATTANPLPTYDTFDGWTAWAFILGIEYNGYTMLRTLEAAGLTKARLTPSSAPPPPAK